MLKMMNRYKNIKFDLFSLLTIFHERHRSSHVAPGPKGTCNSRSRCSLKKDYARAINNCQIQSLSETVITEKKCWKYLITIDKLYLGRYVESFLYFTITSVL